MDSVTDPLIPEAADPVREREVLTEGRGRTRSRELAVLLYEPAETLAAFGRVAGDILGKAIGERPFTEPSLLRKLPILSLPVRWLLIEPSSRALCEVNRESDLGFVFSNVFGETEAVVEGYLRSGTP